MWLVAVDLGPVRHSVPACFERKSNRREELPCNGWMTLWVTFLPMPSCLLCLKWRLWKFWFTFQLIARGVAATKFGSLLWWTTERFTLWHQWEKSLGLWLSEQSGIKYKNVPFLSKRKPPRRRLPLGTSHISSLSQYDPIINMIHNYYPARRAWLH